MVMSTSFIADVATSFPMTGHAVAGLSVETRSPTAAVVAGRVSFAQLGAMLCGRQTHLHRPSESWPLPHGLKRSPMRWPDGRLWQGAASERTVHTAAFNDGRAGGRPGPRRQYKRRTG